MPEKESQFTLAANPALYWIAPVAIVYAPVVIFAAVAAQRLLTIPEFYTHNLYAILAAATWPVAYRQGFYDVVPADQLTPAQLSSINSIPRRKAALFIATLIPFNLLLALLDHLFTFSPGTTAMIPGILAWSAASATYLQGRKDALSHLPARAPENPVPSEP